MLEEVAVSECLEEVRQTDAFENASHIIHFASYNSCTRILDIYKRVVLSTL